ncbi:MAG: ATP-binding protein [Elusimicrobia bacterium]|nr:ATP-binding protein [Elusimicrobiota bacterium]
MRRSLEGLLETEHFGTAPPKMAFLVGPRQAGKTTLAKALQERRGSAGLYRNWDDLAFRRELAGAPYAFLDAFRPSGARRPLAVLDEVHKFPRWKTYLKGLWDTRQDAVDVLVTGSGRLDIYQRGGDSLLGRYHQYRLHPLSVSEAVGVAFHPDRDDPEKVLARLLRPPPPAAGAAEAFATLLRFGGFPESFLAQSERRHRLWLRERRERLTREDLRDLSRIQMLSSVEQMVELMLPRVGSLFSLNNLRQELGVSLDSVRTWVAQLERLYFCWRLRPFAGRLARALSREPKVYLYDWSELPEQGARFENMVASALLRWCHFAEDWGQEPVSVHFVRDKEKREVDFLVAVKGRPRLLVEAKVSDTAPGAALRRFSEKLGGVPSIVVVARLERPGTAAGVPVVPAAWFLAQMP